MGKLLDWFFATEDKSAQPLTPHSEQYAVNVGSHKEHYTRPKRK